MDFDNITTISNDNSSISSTNSSYNKKLTFDSIINKTWLDIFDKINPDLLEITEQSYNQVVKYNKKNIFPCYKNIFNFTNYSTFDDIKVVILGQDPYHSIYFDKITKLYTPNATGLAFSVPKTCDKLPPSLNNIYDNLLRNHNHIYKPKHGCLDYWGFQGVLLLNTSLTVEKSKPNSHQSIWSMFTDELIQTISQEHKNLIFVLWGSTALSKMNIIKNKDNHHFLISSHPSSLSCHNKLKSYESFYNSNHFENINMILANTNKYIDWQIY